MNIPMNSDKENSLVIFENKEIRRTWFNNQWWFVIQDIVAVLTDSVDPKGYPDYWIEKRVRGIAIRDELTDEWSRRSVKAEDILIRDLERKLVQEMIV